MTSCQEFCRSASDCAPCSALDAELDRIALGRVPAYVEGLDEDGRYAVLNGRRVRRPEWE